MKIKCKICGSSFLKSLLRYENMPAKAQFFPERKNLEKDTPVVLEVYQCLSCGVIQLASSPVSYYKEVIRASSFSQEMQRFRKRQFRNFIKRFSLEGKKIVEIGCGQGEYLSIMKECGANTYGIEYSKKSVKQCFKKGLKVSQGFVDNAQFKIDYAPFDAFFMLSFLEHLPSPCETLRGIYNNLKEEGVGIVEVPNFNMIVKKKLFSEFISDHLFYFSKDTLRRTLEISGFEVIECKEIWYDYIISAWVRKRKKLELTSFYRHQEKVKKEIESYIKNKKIAVWGAGHQALAALSLFKLKDRVRYVVDSATFKQGKFTPATHIPVVSPQKLEEDPPQALIIMAGSYSDEVAKIVKEKFSKIQVAILRDFGLEKL